MASGTQLFFFLVEKYNFYLRDTVFRASRIAYEDTYNTLQYAERAKAIRVEVHSNVVSADTHISQYVTVIETLKRQVSLAASTFDFNLLHVFVRINNLSRCS